MAEVGTIDWVTKDGPTDCLGEDGPTDYVGEDEVTSENDASGLNVWVRKLTVCSWWAAEMGVVVWATEMEVVVWAIEIGVVVWTNEMGVVVWATEMGVVVWATDMGVVVWATDIGVVSVMVASLNWMGGTLILLLGSDGGDRRWGRGCGGRCARGRRLRVAVGGTVVSESVLTLCRESSRCSSFEASSALNAN